jgi:hypothetical protein
LNRTRLASSPALLTPFILVPATFLPVNWRHSHSLVVVATSLVDPRHPPPALALGRSPAQLPFPPPRYLAILFLVHTRLHSCPPPPNSHCGPPLASTVPTSSLACSSRESFLRFWLSVGILKLRLFGCWEFGLSHSVSSFEMDMKSLQVKLGLFDQEKVVRKAQELLRLCRVHFDSSSFGVVSLSSV